MTNAPTDAPHTIPEDAEAPEPPDDNGYRILAFSFLIGMVVIIALFIVMLVLLAGASR